MDTTKQVSSDDYFNNDDFLNDDDTIAIVNEIKGVIQADIEENRVQDYNRYEPAINEILKTYNPENKKIFFWHYITNVGKILQEVTDEDKKINIIGIFKKTKENNDKKSDNNKRSGGKKKTKSKRKYRSKRKKVNKKRKSIKKKK